MVSVGNCTRQHLSHYFRIDDYYFSENKTEIEVYGSAAELLKNDSPENRLELFEKYAGEREMSAKDVTFSAPKSVSIAAGLGNDKIRKITVQAHKKAVEKSLKYIEDSGLFQVQKKENGVLKKYPAKGMLALSVLHSTSREKDPQLHSHCPIANAGIIPGETQTRSVNYAPIYQNQQHLDDIYKATLRAELERAGIPTRITRDGFEIASITDEQIVAFSTRRAQVDANLREMNLTRETANGEQRQQAALNGRGVKDVQIDAEHLRATWRQTAASLGVQIERRESPAARLDAEQLDDAHCRLVAEGLEEWRKTNAIGTRREAVAHILKYAKIEGQGEARDGDPGWKKNRREAAKTLSYAEISRYLPQAMADAEMMRLPGQSAPQSDYLQEQLISAKLLRSEAENAQYLKHGKDLYAAPAFDVGKAVDQAAAKLYDFKFQGEQREAAIGTLQSRDFICCVQGDPGTGKTTMLRAVVAVQGQDNMIGLSVSGAAAMKFSEETGFKTQTVAKFLSDYQKRQENPNDPKIQERTAYIDQCLKPGSKIIIDEASMLGSEDANALCRIAAERRAQIVAVGDRYQLPGIAAGSPFEKWQDQGAETFRLQEIRRQRGADELAAVQSITQRQDALEAAKILQSKECVREIGDDQKRLEAITADYMREIREGRNAPLLITGTNAAKDELNAQIREQMKKDGRIAAEGEMFACVNSRKEEVRREFVQGDQIVFLKNNNEGKIKSQAEIKNGHQAQIDKIKDGKIEATLLDDEGRRTDQKAAWAMDDYNFVDHSYALSTYKSQGQSVERLVQYHAPASSPLLSKNEFLVGISRNKESVAVYTDQADKMADKASAWVHKDEGLRQWKKGVERDQGGSEYVNLLSAAAERKQSRDREILDRRQALADKHGGKVGDIPKRQRDGLNGELNQSREIFYADVSHAEKSQPGADRMTDLEQDAAEAVEHWRKDSAEENKKFREDRSRAAKVNHFRRQNKIDGELSTNLCEMSRSGELDRETAQINRELDTISKRDPLAKTREQSAGKPKQTEIEKQPESKERPEPAEQSADRENLRRALDAERHREEQKERQREEDEDELHGPR